MHRTNSTQIKVRTYAYNENLQHVLQMITMYGIENCHLFSFIEFANWQSSDIVSTVKTGFSKSRNLVT